MKKFLSVALVVCILIGMLSALPMTASAATSGTCGDNVTWTLSDDGTLTISGIGAMYDYDHGSVVPWYSSKSQIKKVVIGNNVTTIGDYAFSGCYALTSITIPDSVTTIGDGAFYYCTSLTSITIPNSVTTIGDGAFYYCTSLTSITIPNSVTTIGDYAFYDCDALESVTIGNSVTTIGDYAFFCCEELESVTIGSSVKIIGDYAFYDCVALTSINIPNSVTTIGEKAFYACVALTSINIPNSVTTIGDYAFRDCDALTSITIPDSVTTIGKSAFYGCTALKSVTIGSSVKTIGDYAFYNCDALTSINIPNSVTTIGGSAFRYCDALTSITIPDSVTTIGDYAFYNCAALTSITIPDSVTTIGDYAFYWCTALKSVTIGNSVTTIGDRAFYMCDALTSINIPNSVTTIGDGAFYDCVELTSITIPDSVTTIGDDAFSYCVALKSVTIGNSVTTIGRSAFESCAALTSITIPDSVTTIGDYAFFDCYALKSVTIGNSVTTIGEEAFSYCDALESVTIGNSVTTIGNWAFYWCDALKDVYYTGTKAQWNKIIIVSGNYCLTDANIHYKTNSDMINDASGWAPGVTPSTQDVVTKVGNAINLTNIKLGSFQVTEETLKGPEINIANKSFHLFELPIGMSISSSLFKAKYNADKEKFEITIGALDKTKLKGEADENKTYNEIKEFINYCGKDTSTATWNKYQHLKKVLKQENMSFGFKFNATHAGYMEFDKTGKFLEGSIIYILNMDANYKQPIPAAPVVYVKVGLEVDATGKFGIKSIESNMYSIYGSLGLDVSPYVGVGVGDSKWLNAEGGAKLKLSTELELIRNKKLSEVFSASMTGQLYVKLKALSFINFDKKWDIAKVSIYPNFGASLMSVADSTDDMIVMPRNYLDEESAFVANDSVSLFALDTIETAVFKTNVYPYSESQLIKLNNGKEMMVWVDDDRTRTDINCTVLKYSVNDGTNWSEPKSVYDDGMAEFSPKVVATNDGAAMVWQKANSVLSDDIGLTEMAKNIDLYYATFDGKEWSAPIKLTDNTDVYEFTPDIAVSGNEITVTWLTNSENDCFGMAGTNSINSKTFSQTWGQPVVQASDLGCVSNLQVCYIDGEAIFVYTVDGDGDVETSADIELYEIREGTTEQITNDSVMEYGLSKTKNGYFWMHNDQLWERTAYGVELVKIPVSAGYLGNAKILTNGQDKVIVYEQTNEYSSDLYAMYYDNDDSAWGEPIRLTADNKKIRGTNGYLTTDGALRLVFGQAEIDESKDDIYGKCNIMLSNITEKVDIQTISAGCVFDTYAVGEDAFLYITVSNNSSSKVSRFNVEMKAEDDIVLSDNVDLEISSGETVVMELPFVLPDDLSNKNYTVTVTPVEKTDAVSGNNTASFEMGFADLVVSVSAENNKVNTIISNEGCLDAQNITCVLKTAEGEVLESETIQTITVGEKKKIEFLGIDAENVVVDVTTDSPENLYGNNTKSIGLMALEPKGVHMILGEYEASEETLEVRATALNDSGNTEDATICVVFYKNGVMIDFKIEPITIESMKTKNVSMQIPSSLQADTVKLFIWEQNDKFSPFNNVAILNIEYPGN